MFIKIVDTQTTLKNILYRNTRFYVPSLFFTLLSF